MRSAKSISSIPNTTANMQPSNHHDDTNKNNSSTSPICRCRVMYLGSSVPHITKDGLQGIQEPLRELYPDKSSLASGNAGIDSWLSVWSNGILIENVDETGRETKRFFKIDALHYCAAVKYVPTSHSLAQAQNNAHYATLSSNPTSSSSSPIPTFLPLDSPHARQINSSPPIFASILRRTTGIKVLECHAFICKREAAANALVRCCFHAYADTMYAKQIGADVNILAQPNQSNDYDASKSNIRSNQMLDANHNEVNHHSSSSRRSKSIANLHESQQNEGWQSRAEPLEQRYDTTSEYSRTPISRRKNSHDSADIGSSQQQLVNENLRRQQKLSKSMHQINQNGIIYNQSIKSQVNDHDYDQSTSASCMNGTVGRPDVHDPRFLQQVPQPAPFFNPTAGRVPSYPPYNMVDGTNNGGTLRSIRSMAANSIASTLMRSKKHAKAMSSVHMNQDKVTSFHQPQFNGNTINGSMMMPPVPPMFLPHLQNRPFINGSQTMKLPNRSLVPMIGSPANFETLTPKEIKKMLKKSAKYGLDQRAGDHGFPLLPMGPPPPPPLGHSMPAHIAHHNGSGTMVSQSIYSDLCNSNNMDLASVHGLPGPPIPEVFNSNHAMKPILVRPNAEFLKSKAGKKWSKQQKEFKKLLPPHLDGLPIIFGPPPLEALEPVHLPEDIPPMVYMEPPVPMMDAAGYYNPNQFYNQNGRASAASTLLRYSPHSQMVHETGVNSIYAMHRNHHMNVNNIHSNPPNLVYMQPREQLNDNTSMIYNGDHCNMNQHVRPSDGLRHQKRNHMVEQSVISLGDENDYEDEEENENVTSNSYYGPGQSASDSRANPRRSRSTQSLAKSNMHLDQNDQQSDNHHDRNTQPYEQINHSNDDQGSYSSGIYKRGHINERAFSYSIQQEHKSSGGNNSEAESSEVAMNGGLRNQGYPKQYHNSNHHRADPTFHASKDKFYNDRLESQNAHSSQVNQLTARLESQLNMKSFSNSRVKS